MSNVMVKRDKTKRDTYTLGSLLDMFDRGELRNDHPEQRKPLRWGSAIRDGFIATVLKEEDVDSIKVCEQVYEDAVDLWLIDGLQRLSNAKMFKMGAFKLGKAIEFPTVVYQTPVKDASGNFVTDENGRRKYDTIEYDLRGKSYNDLPIELKTVFNNYTIDIVKQLNCTNEEVGYHIRRYNAKVNMNGNEKAITYLDKIALRIKGIAKHNFFKDCTNFSENDMNAGKVERAVMETLMFTYFGNAWKKQAREQGTYLNDNCTDDHFNSLTNLLDEMEEVLEDRHCELFTAKNTLVWVKAFDRFMTKYVNKGVDKFLFDDFLTEFENTLSEKEVDLLSPQKILTNMVEQCSYQVYDTLKSSKDKNYLENKLHIIEELIDEFIQDKVEANEKTVEFAKEDSNVVKNAMESILETISNDLNEITENQEQMGNIVSEENCNSPLSDFEFVKYFVNPDVEEEDIECYLDVLEELTLEVDNNTKLLEEANHNSLVGIVAYAFIEEEDIDSWFPKYFAKNKDYDKDQEKNYLRMKNDFDNFVKNVA